MENIGNTKSLLELLCKEADGLVPGVKVELVLGYKPNGYYVPSMIFSSKQINDVIEMAYFAEIYVSQACVYRESALIRDKDTEKGEDAVRARLLRSVFCHGVHLQSEQLKKIKENIWKT